MSNLLDLFTTPRQLDGRSVDATAVRSVRRHGERAVSIELDAPRSWSGHLPGQFTVVGARIDGVWHERCFSLTSRSGDRPEITVQATPDGVVSRHLVAAARPGLRLRLAPATGAFVLPESPGRLLFVTAGSGLTPVVSMIRTLAAGRPADRDLDVVWVHHARTSADLLFADELARWSGDLPWLRLDLRFTGMGDRRFGVDEIDTLCPDWADRATFACGPDAMRAALTDHWHAADLEHRLVVESFRAGAADSRPTGLDGPAVVLAARSDRVFDGSAVPTLLEAAEAAGLAPRSGCRMGICHTCTTRLDAGTVVDVRDGRRSGAGCHVQLCVTAPDGDVTLDL